MQARMAGTKKVIMQARTATMEGMAGMMESMMAWMFCKF